MSKLSSYLSSRPLLWVVVVLNVLETARSVYFGQYASAFDSFVVILAVLALLSFDKTIREYHNHAKYYHNCIGPARWADVKGLISNTYGPFRRASRDVWGTSPPQSGVCELPAYREP